MNNKLKIKLGLLIILLLIAVLAVNLVWQEDRNGILTVAFLNVRQGDAIFIESPTGNQMLIDGGPGKSVLRELSAVMPFYDRSIDAVLATHADQDHVGGLPDVLNRYKVDLFFESGNPGPSASFEELEKITKQKRKEGNLPAQAGMKKLLARRGMVVTLGGGAIVEILFPDRDPSGLETNMSSIVVRLVYGESEFLLTGDSPMAIERYLVSLSPEGRLQGSLQSDVLKAGHHGSKTSTSPEFVAAVAPKYGIISAGKDNRYGHPTTEVLETLSSAGAQILRTDRDGRIIFKSDGVKLELK